MTLIRLQDLKFEIILVLLFCVVCLGISLCVTAENTTQVTQVAVETFQKTAAAQVLNTEVVKSSYMIQALVMFFNNALVAFLLVVVARVNKWLAPLLMVWLLGINMFVLGAITYYAGTTMGLPFVIAGLAPHGVFELSAFVLAGALGVHYTTRAFAQGKHSIKPYLKSFGAMVIPLLAVAAFMEAYVTRFLLELVTGIFSFVTMG